ncbi:hypothetical protein V1512DRAFT_261894 [Lipomyces arxii]|uniref:uncharacterized protein n=1 Tax=Lipomyces arxii TaxID=56418 RepID=UPI0034CF03D8
MLSFSPPSMEIVQSQVIPTMKFNNKSWSFRLGGMKIIKKQSQLLQRREQKKEQKLLKDTIVLSSPSEAITLQEETDKMLRIQKLRRRIVIMRKREIKIAKSHALEVLKRHQIAVAERRMAEQDYLTPEAFARRYHLLMCLRSYNALKSPALTQAARYMQVRLVNGKWPRQDRNKDNAAHAGVVQNPFTCAFYQHNPQNSHHCTALRVDSFDPYLA